MNLYEVNFMHYSPKDYEEGIKGYILAENDEDVYEKLKSYNSNPFDFFISNMWCEWEEDEEENYRRESIIENRGEHHFEDLINDTYYGVTTYGWNLVKEDVTQDEVNLLNGLGLLA